MCLLDKKKYRISLFPIKCYKYFKIDENGNLRNYYRNQIVKSRFLIPEKDSFDKVEFRHDYFKFNGGFIHAMQKPSTYPVILVLECTIPPLTRYAIGESGDICARAMIITDKNYSNNYWRKSNLNN